MCAELFVVPGTYFLKLTLNHKTTQVQHFVMMNERIIVALNDFC